MYSSVAELECVLVQGPRTSFLPMPLGGSIVISTSLTSLGFKKTKTKQAQQNNAAKSLAPTWHFLNAAQNIHIKYSISQKLPQGHSAYI